MAFEAGGELYQYKRLPFGVTNGVSAFQRSIDCFTNRYQLRNVYAYLDDLTVTGETIEEHDLNLKRLQVHVTLLSTKTNRKFA